MEMFNSLNFQFNYTSFLLDIHNQNLILTQQKIFIISLYLSQHNRYCMFSEHLHDLTRLNLHNDPIEEAMPLSTSLIL